MILDLNLKNFRSYQDDSFEFGKGVNIIVGPNASGKTNLLEAILMICLGSSYRVKDLDVIRFNQPWTRLDSDTPDGKRILIIEKVNKDNTVNNLSSVGQTTKKKYVINDVEYRRLVINKTLPVVVFEPDHLRLLSGGPERRRDYLDNLLEQTVTGFSKLRRDYKRTLLQRNKLLKTPGVNDSDFFVWNVRLSEIGGQIVRYRIDIIENLKNRITDLYQELSNSETKVKLKYSSKCNLDSYSTNLLTNLERNLEQDRFRGFTSFGPHRDDLEVSISEHLASLSASRGETRTILLALKILELKILKQSRNKKPILLLDDVFSELDGSRRKALTNYLKDYQTFITTTDADIVVQHFMDKCTIIPITHSPSSSLSISL